MIPLLATKQSARVVLPSNVNERGTELIYNSFFSMKTNIFFSCGLLNWHWQSITKIEIKSVWQLIKRKLPHVCSGFRRHLNYSCLMCLYMSCRDGWAGHRPWSTCATIHRFRMFAVFFCRAMIFSTLVGVILGSWNIKQTTVSWAEKV